MKSLLSTKKRYFLVYTVLFLILFWFCFGRWFALYNKTYFRSYDGLDQHYLIFIYVGRWIRTVIKNIFVLHTFTIPMWDYGIGYGADCLTSTAAYLPDPFNWIAALTPEEWSETVFSITIIAKIWLCGIAFSLFSFQKKNPCLPTLAGAIVYVFCAETCIVFFESFFINPMYIFPILLIGFDRLWNENKPAVYVLSFAFSCINYFYFAYMMSIFVIMHYFATIIYNGELKNDLKNCFMKSLHLLGASILGLGISMIVFLPVTSVILQTGRLNLETYLPLFFDKNYYGNLFAGFLCGNSLLYRDCEIGFAAIALPCVISLFIQKKNVLLKTYFLFLTFALCLPYAGHVMNGFSYTASRWIFAYCLCVAYIVTTMLPQMHQLSFRQFLCMQAVIVLYIFIIYHSYHYDSISFNVTVMLSWLCALACWTGSRRLNTEWYGYMTVLLTAFSAFTLCYFTLSKEHRNYLVYEVDRGTAYEKLNTSGGIQLLETLDLPPGSRYDKYGLPLIRNVSWLHGISGMDLYISIYNNNIDRFHNEIGLRTNPSPMDYIELNRRSELMHLFNVKAYLFDMNRIQTMPYGYNYLVGDLNISNYHAGAATSVFPTSTVYGFNRVISDREFETLSPYERQQALMQSVIVKDVSEQNSEKIEDLNIDGNSLTYRKEFLNDLTITDNKIHVAKENGQLLLTFKEVKDSELYLYVDGLHFQNGRQATSQIEAQGQYNGQSLNDCYSFTTIANYYSHMYGGKHRWLLNLGYTKGPVNQILIRFNKPGDYQLDDIQVYQRTNQTLERSIQGLHPLAYDTEFRTNRMLFNIYADSAQTALVTMPYSKGWSAWIDGVPTSIHLADIAFMAVNMPKGNHILEFQYRTPYLLPGLIITAISFFLFALWCKILKNTKKLHKDSPR